MLQFIFLLLLFAFSLPNCYELWVLYELSLVKLQRAKQVLKRSRQFLHVDERQFWKTVIIKVCGEVVLPGLFTATRFLVIIANRTLKQNNRLLHFLFEMSL